MAVKVALSISGSDSSGGAGVQADLKVFTILGVYGMTALTAVTAQNTLGVKEIREIGPELVARQIDVSAGDIEVDAVKTGMLATIDTIAAVADALKRNKLARYVCDPAFFARSGDALFKGDAAGAIKKHLLPLATVVTPNRAEAALLSGAEKDQINSIPAAKEVARQLVGLGARAAVIKAIVVGADLVDLLFDGKEFLEFAGKAQPAQKSHGSGDAFSAAITAGLAIGKTLPESVDQAKQLVSHAIQYSDGQGRGTSPINVLAFAPKKK